MAAIPTKITKANIVIGINHLRQKGDKYSAHQNLKQSKKTTAVATKANQPPRRVSTRDLDEAVE